MADMLSKEVVPGPFAGLVAGSLGVMFWIDMLSKEVNRWL